MTIFDEMAPVALEMIDELELDIVVQERAIAEDPTAGTGTVTPTPRPAKAALRDFEETIRAETRTRVTTGLVIVPASYLPNGAEPGWSVFLAAVTTDPASEYTVISAERVPKIGTPIVWRLKVER